MTARLPFYCPDCGSFDRRNWSRGGCRYFDGKPELAATGVDPPCACDAYVDEMNTRSRRAALWTSGTIVVLAIMVGLFGCWPADAQERGAWFKSLKQPGSGFSCCDISDCKKTDAEWRDGQWWADFQGRMIPVPPERELDVLSIDGEAYLCSNPPNDAAKKPSERWTEPNIYCFVKPGMGS